MRTIPLVLFVLLVGLDGVVAPVRAAPPFRILVVDAENGWPVPLVELRTTNKIRSVTDNRGLVAFDLPEFIGQETWLTVTGHGYSVPADRFGFQGVRVVPKPGQQAIIKVQRALPAKRLGRITGGGQFAESQKLGDEVLVGGKPWREQKVLGCDSVLNAVHQGRLFWFWGDTNLARYPLGRFHSIGATTVVRPLANFRPPIKLRYQYVTGDDGVPGNVAKMPGQGPTWLSGCISLSDQQHRERLVASYAKIKPPLTVYEHGLCVWDDKQKKFKRHRVVWRKETTGKSPSAAPRLPHGHPVLWSDAQQRPWVLCGDPFPTLKFPANFESWGNPSAWQKLEPQKTVPRKDGQGTVRPHRGAIAWNKFRNKWVTVFTQVGGKSSYLGELWYAEADQPTGPWKNAIHIVTHANYSFYNPKLHVEWVPDKSPILLFEATYTKMFSKATVPTPRHDYNQVLYRLDLDQLQLP